MLKFCLIPLCTFIMDARKVVVHPNEFQGTFLKHKHINFEIIHVLLELFSLLKVVNIQVEPIRNFFAALFLASIGMLIHVHFLWNHVDILLAAVILVIIIKTVVAAAVVKGFGYNNKTSLLVRFDNSYYNYICLLITSYISLTEEPQVIPHAQVGMSLAQIGEFAFVLLSRASNLHLVEV